MRRIALFTSVFSLALSACFSEDVTLDLPCQQDEHCGLSQVCDAVSNRCVFPENASKTDGTGPEEGTEDADAGEACAVEDAQRCAPGGVDVQICSSGVWLPFDCDTVCADANPPPSKQVGACVDNGGNISCTCADGIGGECMGNEPRTCTSAGLLEFCDSGRFFRLECTTDCADEGYPTAGPCVDDPTQGAADCVCADGLGASCSPAEQFAEECIDSGFFRKCVDGQWYQTSCADECARRGMTGGSCQVNGSVASCVCG